MKRIFELSRADVKKMSKNDILECIKTTEGRSVMAETVISCQSLVGGVSNPETASSFGADMITLNNFDINNPYIMGFKDCDEVDDSVATNLRVLADHIDSLKDDIECISELREVTGRLIGLNLEPTPISIDYNDGYRLTESNLKKLLEYKFNYLVITANPNTMVGEDDILEGIKLAKKIIGHEIVIIAGKMHGAGAGNIYDNSVLEKFANAGADVILIPAPLTVPGLTVEVAKEMIDVIHSAGKLALTAMGTSQEGADRAVVEQIALMSKVAGSDIIHIGDAGLSGMADPENIKYTSIAVRGKRHTYKRIAYRK